MWLIERSDDGQPRWLSLSIGRDFAHPGTGWTSEHKDALQFTREVDAKAYMATYIGTYDAPFCRTRQA